MAGIIIIVFIIILAYVCFTMHKNENLVPFVGYEGTRFNPNNYRKMYPYWASDAYNK